MVFPPSRDTYHYRQSSLFKTVRCRYFDEDGRGIRPYCSLGSRCRFIHPSDCQWDSIKPTRNNSCSSYRHGHNEKSKGKGKARMTSHSPSRQSRPSPLPSQLALFKQETESVCSSRPKSRQDHMQYASEVGLSSQQYSVPATAKVQRTDPRYMSIEKLEHPSVKVIPSHTDTCEASKPPLPEKGMTSAFRHIARLCSQLSRDACTLEREEDKLRTFTQLSSELYQVAPKAAGMISPALAGVIGSHSLCKGQVEKNLAALDQAWEDLFMLVKQEFANIADVRTRIHESSIQGKGLIDSRANNRHGRDRPEAEDKARSSQYGGEEVLAKRPSSTRCEVLLLDSEYTEGPSCKRHRANRHKDEEIDSKHEISADTIGMKDLLQSLKAQCEKQLRALESVS